jgi:nitroreductase
VVRDEKIRAALGELMRRAWEGGAKQWSQSRLNEKMLADVDAGMHGGVASAPVLLVVCGNTQRGMEVTLGASIFPAVQNLLLAATALQLGSALTTIATHYQKELQELLKLPAHVNAMAVIPVGYPARVLGKSKRNPLSTCTHSNEFGEAWE